MPKQGGIYADAPKRGTREGVGCASYMQVRAQKMRPDLTRQWQGWSNSGLHTQHEIAHIAKLRKAGCT